MAPPEEEDEEEFFEAEEELPPAGSQQPGGPELQRWTAEPGSIQERREGLLTAMRLLQQRRSSTRVTTQASQPSRSSETVSENTASGRVAASKQDAERLRQQVDGNIIMRNGGETGERISNENGIGASAIQREYQSTFAPVVSTPTKPKNGGSSAEFDRDEGRGRSTPNGAEGYRQADRIRSVERVTKDLVDCLAPVFPAQPNVDSGPLLLSLGIQKQQVNDQDIAQSSWDAVNLKVDSSAQRETENATDTTSSADVNSDAFSRSSASHGHVHPPSDTLSGHVRPSFSVSEDKAPGMLGQGMSSSLAAMAETPPWPSPHKQAGHARNLPPSSLSHSQGDELLQSAKGSFSMEAFEPAKLHLRISRQEGERGEESEESSDNRLTHTTGEDSEISDDDWASPVLSALEVSSVEVDTFVPLEAEKADTESNAHGKDEVAQSFDERMAQNSNDLSTEQSGSHEDDEGGDSDKRNVGVKRSTWGRGGAAVVQDIGNEDIELLVRKIKDLDTGREFILDDEVEPGAGKSYEGLAERRKKPPLHVLEVGTGRKFSFKEFEDTLGISPLTKELQRRQRQGHLREEVESGGMSSEVREQDEQPGCVPYGEGGGGKKRGWLKGRRGKGAGNKTESVGDGGIASTHVKVYTHRKKSKELSDLRLGQEIAGHEGYICALKFSWDGRFLASAGQDKVVKVWEVLHPPSSNARTQPRSVIPVIHFSASERDGSGQASVQVKDGARTKGEIQAHGMRGKVGDLPNSGANSVNEKNEDRPTTSSAPTDSFNVTGDSKSSFRLREQPIRCWQGHDEEVLDLSWSKQKPYKFVLSASSDKTVRLWHVDEDACLRVFRHSDWVTCVDFSPKDKRLFVSGSLDRKVRLWSMAAEEHAVQDWTDLREWITAVTFSSDGQSVVVGSHKGSCRYYGLSDRKLRLQDTVEVKSGRGKASVGGKRITRLQSFPGTARVLVTSNDSRIRVYHKKQLLCKYKGYKNAEGQMAASFSSSGSYIVCASEDSHVYVWSTVPAIVPTMYTTYRKDKSNSYEYFPSENAIVAVFWPGLSQQQQVSPGELNASDESNTTSEAESGPGESSRAFPGKQEGDASLEGAVIVTGSREGEIRAYQNFGAKISV